MTLAALIEKGGLARLATATSATPATERQDGLGTVARVATVAAPNVAPRYRWRVSLPDGTRLEVCCLPQLTAAEMLERYADARLVPLPDAPTEPYAKSPIEWPLQADRLATSSDSSVDRCSLLG